MTLKVIEMKNIKIKNNNIIAKNIDYF